MRRELDRLGVSLHRPLVVLFLLIEPAQALVGARVLAAQVHGLVGVEQGLLVIVELELEVGDPLVVVLGGVRLDLGQPFEQGDRLGEPALAAIDRLQRGHRLDVVLVQLQQTLVGLGRLLELPQLELGLGEQEPRLELGARALEVHAEDPDPRPQLVGAVEHVDDVAPGLALGGAFALGHGQLPDPVPGLQGLGGPLLPLQQQRVGALVGDVLGLEADRLEVEAVGLLGHLVAAVDLGQLGVGRVSLGDHPEQPAPGLDGLALLALAPELLPEVDQVCVVPRLDLDQLADGGHGALVFPEALVEVTKHRVDGGVAREALAAALEDLHRLLLLAVAVEALGQLDLILGLPGRSTGQRAVLGDHILATPAALQQRDQPDPGVNGVGRFLERGAVGLEGLELVAGLVIEAAQHVVLEVAAPLPGLLVVLDQGLEVLLLPIDRNDLCGEIASEPVPPGGEGHGAPVRRDGHQLLAHLRLQATDGLEHVGLGGRVAGALEDRSVLHDGLLFMTTVGQGLGQLDAQEDVPRLQRHQLVEVALGGRHVPCDQGNVGQGAQVALLLALGARQRQGALVGRDGLGGLALLLVKRAQGCRDGGGLGVELSGLLVVGDRLLRLAQLAVEVPQDHLEGVGLGPGAGQGAVLVEQGGQAAVPLVEADELPHGVAVVGAPVQQRLVPRHDTGVEGRALDTPVISPGVWRGGEQGGQRQRGAEAPDRHRLGHLSTTIGHNGLPRSGVSARGSWCRLLQEVVREGGGERSASCSRTSAGDCVERWPAACVAAVRAARRRSLGPGARAFGPYR